MMLGRVEGDSAHRPLSRKLRAKVRPGGDHDERCPPGPLPASPFRVPHFALLLRYPFQIQ
jgi:hypothetical protein